MAGDYAPIDISTTPELRRVAEEVRKTRRPQTLRVADGVVAVVKPERKPASHKATLPSATRRTPSKTYTLEDVFGIVADTGGPRDFDQMIRDAKEERADRLHKQLRD